MYVPTVAVGQRQRLYSSVRMLAWFYLSSINFSGWSGALKGSILDLGH
jgi:hypothetical protein